MARFHQAVQEAAAHLAGDPVSLATWAHTVRRCDQLLAGTDPAMRSAAALTPVLTTADAGLRRQGLILALDGDPGLPVSAGDRQELRVVALYVTRAASREADPSQRLLLAGIERRLLGGSPARGSFEASLRGWSHAVAEASEAMDPVAALAVSRIQRTLLDAGVEAMNRLEVADGVGHERLLAAVETSRDAWARAYDAWLEIVPRKALYIEGLDRATVGVQLAARDASDIDKLRGLLVTGFGGNLAAAMAVTPADMRVDSDLVARAVTLEQRSDLAAAIQPREFREPEPVAVPVEPSDGPAVRFTTSSEAASSPRPAVLRQGLEVETVNFGERGRLEELAGERDAGVIAGAARAGVVEAVALVGGATVAELVRLVERGERAQAAIAASALPIVYSWSRRFAPEHRQEFVARASLQLAEVASKWDPRVAGWSTFAYSVVDYAYRGEARRLGTSREVTSEDVGRWAGESPSRSTVTVQRSPEAEALWGAELDQVTRLLDQLPDRMRVVMEGRLGLAGSVKTFAALAEETGVSPRIVSRDAREGTRLLREHHLAAKATQENPSPDSTAVTLRHLAQVLQPTKEDRSRTPTSARPEHRSGRPSRDVRGVSR